MLQIPDHSKDLYIVHPEKCLNQYAMARRDFYFYGALPIDFRKCKVSPLCKFSLLKHKLKGHNKIGIVFNTDEHD